MIVSNLILWQPIANIPDNRKDGRKVLLWEGDRPVIGHWDAWDEQWRSCESERHLENLVHWADINPPA